MPLLKSAEEKKRLAAVRRLKAIDSEPEERFDRYTRLAGLMLDMPLVYFSIVDTRRVRLKSRQGLPYYIREVDREGSFCDLTVLDDAVLHSPDTLRDARFSSCRMVVSEPHIRSFIGCSVAVTDGSKVGVFGLMDTAPRSFDAGDIELVRQLSTLLEQELVAGFEDTLDPLTKLSNRTGVEVLGAYTLQRCRLVAKRATLFCFRLQGLEEIDAKIREKSSAKALNTFAQILRNAFKELDVIGRIGPDTFAVVLTGMNSIESTYTLARLESTVEKHQLEQDGYRLAFVTELVHFTPERHPSIQMLMAECETALDAACLAEHSHRRSSVA